MTFVGLSVPFTIKNVAKMRPAVVANRLQATKVLAYTYVAEITCMVAFVECLAKPIHGVRRTAAIYFSVAKAQAWGARAVSLRSNRSR